MNKRNKEATIVTFYSYKGGVGRSMALANIAWLLAEGSRRRVLVVDWDLEAPGLHRFFGLKDEDISTGLIEALNDYKDLLRKETGSLPEKLVDLRKYVQPVKAFSDGGSISILAAGRQEDAAAYAATINAFSWEEFYAKWHGFGFIEDLKQQLRTFDETDIVLVDSRTGVTDIGGICTLQLPDVVVILFAMNDQNIWGAKSVAERISKKAGELEGRDAPPVLILRPARVERSSGNQDKKIEWQGKAARELGEYFTDRDAETVIAKRNIPYVSDFSYGETPLAVVKDPLGDMTDSFKDLAASIMEIADRANEEVRPVETPQSRSVRNLVRFLQIRAQVFLSQRRNVYLLALLLALFALTGFSLIKIRNLTQTSLALQQRNHDLQAKLDLEDERLKQQVLEYEMIRQAIKNYVVDVQTDPSAEAPFTSERETSPVTWTLKPPDVGWCYQENRVTPGNGQFSVHCHWSIDRCQSAQTRLGERQKSDCLFVQGLSSSGWNPNPVGWMGSWFKFSDKPFGAPFPQFK